jgi:hypothetical protein
MFGKKQQQQSEDKILLVPLKRGKPTGKLPLAIEEVSQSKAPKARKEQSR